MTKEEAIREIDSLDYYLQNHTDDYGEQSHTAMMMAISALKGFEGMTNKEILFALFPDLEITHASTGAMEIANSECNIMASRKWLDSFHKKGE